MSLIVNVYICSDAYRIYDFVTFQVTHSFMRKIQVFIFML